MKSKIMIEEKLTNCHPFKLKSLLELRQNVTVRSIKTKY